MSIRPSKRPSGGPSGKSIPYAERQRRGYRNHTFSLPDEIAATIATISKRLKMNKSEIIGLATGLLASKLAGQDGA